MDSFPPKRADVVIVGAGMAGLSAARDLSAAGLSVMVVDKGRGVGGRMATRRIGDATFDHGAQFITTRDPDFAGDLSGWRDAGAAAVWCHGFGSEADGHERWRGAPTMNSLPRHMARGLDIRLDQAVASIHSIPGGWCLRGGDAWTLTGRAVLLTAPIPQSLALIRAGGWTAPGDIHDRLAAVEYERCLAVMAVLERPSMLPPPGARAFASGPLAWMADNQAKGTSTRPAVTLHASGAFSLEHWDADRQETGRRLLDVAAEWIGCRVLEFQVHGWRYSKPVLALEERCRVLGDGPPLVMAGDAFGGPRVEGAALSGKAAAAAIVDRLRHGDRSPTPAT